jgi:hypothetical protein
VSTTEIPHPAGGVEPTSPVAPPRPAREPRSARRAKATPPVRAPRLVPRTTRVVLRKLDAWTVLKLSLVYYLALFVVILVAGALLWAGASAAGVVGNIENFMVDIGFEDFKFEPGQLLSGVALGGLVLVVAGTFANVLMTALFNLMSDVVGGLRLTLQEDPDQPRRTDDGNATV